ncbi:MAG: hypothetical protein IT376_13765 [Polyangiaceae bacterium]|nr:hypothetical protein [Polyangiaceae bacterium]
MSGRKELPEFEPRAWQDHATPARVERIWDRLEESLAEAPAKARGRVAWVPAAVAVALVGGFALGRASVPAAIAPALVAEPAAAGPRAAEAPPPEPSVPGDEPAREPPPAPAERARRVRARSAPAPSEVTVAPPSPPASPVAGPTAAAEPSEAGWERAAARGEWAVATGEVDRAGGFAAVARAASADQLMTLHEVMRRTGRRALAASALRQVFERFPSDPNAPLAAWTLATLLEKAGDRAGMAEALAVYRRLSPAGDFAEDALIRQLDAAIEQGDVARARELAQAHARDFPTGRRRAEVAARVARLDGVPVAEADGGAELEPEDEDPAQPPESEPAP